MDCLTERGIEVNREVSKRDVIQLILTPYLVTPTKADCAINFTFFLARCALCCCDVSF